MNYRAWFRHYLGFTAKESKGFLQLIALFGIILLAPTIYDFLLPAPKPIEVQIEELKADSALEIVHAKQVAKKSKPSLFSFDPNTASEDDFVQLGLPAFLAKRIIHYRSKGGRFDKPSDFSKIYGLRKTDFERMLPYIQIAEVGRKEYAKPVFENKKHAHDAPRVIDLNLADTSDLKKINGIGTVLASRIIKYRNKLGGFADAKQLSEVYGLDSSVAKLVSSRFVLQSNDLLKQIEINTLPFDSLAKHPYIGRKAAKILTNYRMQHGEYKSKLDLLKSKALDPEKVEKLVPYLKF